MKFTKTIEVKNIFNKISYKYDFLNNLLSFGLHRLWKRKLVNLLEPLNGEDWADLCCGTGARGKFCLLQWMVMALRMDMIYI